MAYPNGYFNSYYQPQQMNYPVQQNIQQPQQNNSLAWIQGGEASANAYPVAPGMRMWLFDRDEPIFFIKTMDNSGMPQPLRIFDYKERTANTPSNSVVQTQPTENTDYVSRSEFDAFKSEITQAIKQRQNSNSQQKRQKEESYGSTHTT
jgi:hypothetical protein